MEKRNPQVYHRIDGSYNFDEAISFPEFKESRSWRRFLRSCLFNSLRFVNDKGHSVLWLVISSMAIRFFLNCLSSNLSLKKTSSYILTLQVTQNLPVWHWIYWDFGDCHLCQKFPTNSLSVSLYLIFASVF